MKTRIVMIDRNTGYPTITTTTTKNVEIFHAFWSQAMNLILAKKNNNDEQIEDDEEEEEDEEIVDIVQQIDSLIDRHIWWIVNIFFFSYSRYSYYLTEKKSLKLSSTFSIKCKIIISRQDEEREREKNYEQQQTNGKKKRVEFLLYFTIFSLKSSSWIDLSKKTSLSLFLPLGEKKKCISWFHHE